MLSNSHIERQTAQCYALGLGYKQSHSLKDLLLNAAKTGRDMIKMPRLLSADRAKFSRKEISSIVTDNILLGRLNLCEAILKNHQNNPYQSIDELIGDIQIMMVDSNDELRSNNPKHPYRFKVEDLIAPKTEHV